MRSLKAVLSAFQLWNLEYIYIHELKHAYMEICAQLIIKSMITVYAL